MRTSVAESLERVLMSPLVRDVMLDAKACDRLIQRMADNDIASYMGAPGAGGLADIALELCYHGVFTDEIWEILRHPGNPAVPGGGAAE